MISVCYGIANIPHGAWFCRKCEFQDSDDIKVSKLATLKALWIDIIFQAISFLTSSIFRPVNCARAKMVL